VGQPFDIIKVRLQSQNHKRPLYKGAIDCLKKLLKNEGVLALYKGLINYFFLKFQKNYHFSRYLSSIDRLWTLPFNTIRCWWLYEEGH